jgi:signal-transduction protein with cAMP-binding, CBS, and nucleotidyltransferase domain
MDLYIPAAPKELPPPSLLKQCRVHIYEKKDHLFNIENVPEHMFFIASGEAVLSRVNKQGESTILQRCKGGFVGGNIIYHQS